MSKEVQVRIIHKHDTEAHWSLAKNFKPKQGEIIVYDIDSNHTYERFKIGDGENFVNDLPFCDDEINKKLDKKVEVSVDTQNTLIFTL